MRNTSLITGAAALNAHNRLRGQAFDAAGASGFAFLQSQLELIDPNLVQPLQATTHARDITVKNGGGFPEYISAWASNYGSSGGQFYGLQGTNNTEIPQAQVDIQKALWPTFIWSSGFTITYVDLKRMEFAQRTGQPAPFSLQNLYEKSVNTIWGKALDYVTYTGFLGNAGLINNPNVPATVAVNGGSGTTWATKTPSQILTDVNFGINQTVFNSGYDIVEGAADTLLIPYSQFAALTLPMTVGGTPVAMSTIEYIKKNCVLAAYGKELNIFPLPNPWISGTGLGATDRGVFYRNDEECCVLHVPTPKEKAMTVPTTRDGGAYETMFVGNMSCVVFKRTTTMQYLDGI